MDLYTLNEIASILKVSIRTVQRIKATGELQCYYVCGKPRFTQQQIDKYLESTITNESYVNAVNNRTTDAQQESDKIAAKQKGRELTKQLLNR